METLKKIGKVLLFPPLLVIILLIPVSIALLIYSFLFSTTTSVISYITYVVSAYTLTVVCMKIPYLIRWIQKLKKENRLILRLTEDPQLRVKLSLYGSVLINLAYAAFQFALGLYHGSFWFYSLALYYFLLVLVRFFLLRDVRELKPGENMRSELKRYRFCGIILLIQTSALISIVFFMTYFGRTFTHHFITTIAMAAFTFTAMTVAIVNVIRYRRYHSPLFSASKAISLAAAAVSMLTLEAAMFSAFGDASMAQMQGLMTLMTGIGVCLFVMLIAIFMIANGTKRLRSDPSAKE